MKSILSGNQGIADKNREVYRADKLHLLNVMASPGSGKTSLIMRLLPELEKTVQCGVIEGDIASSIDADKFEKMGIPVVQINTGGGCHLDAAMIAESVPDLDLGSHALIFIENVGNLVCPSGFDLGENTKLLVVSIPEGDDKPYKYLDMFETADIIVLNKTDILPHFDFDMEYFYKGVRALNANAPVFELSCKTGDGIKALAEYIENIQQVYIS